MSLTDRWTITHTIHANSNITYIADLRNGNSGFDLSGGSNIYDQNTSNIDLSGDSLFCIVIETHV